MSHVGEEEDLEHKQRGKKNCRNLPAFAIPEVRGTAKALATVLTQEVISSHSQGGYRVRWCRVGMAMVLNE